MKTELVDWQEALYLVRRHSKPFGTEVVTLDQALGRVVGETCKALVNSPRFDNSAVDGFAICDSTGKLTRFALIGEMFAGSDVGSFTLEAGQAVRVLTGAPVPANCDRVLMQEDCCVQEGKVECEDCGKLGEHIRNVGEDFCEGGELVPLGQILNSARLGLLASAGVSEVEVARLPVVGLLTTGDEVREVGSDLRSGEIYDSNSISLRSALKETGILDVRHIHVPDIFDMTQQALAQLLESCDLVVTVGGLADGERDHILGALGALGGEAVFSRVAIKPGKPVSMLKVREKYVFCLPGNPVSALVTCFLFVRYFLMLGQGFSSEFGFEDATCGEEISKKVGRVEFVPGVIRKGEFFAQLERGSHRMSSLAGATHMGIFPSELAKIECGGKIEIFAFDWRLP